MRRLFILASALAAACAMADTTISNVKAHQAWPFDPDIYVTYTLAGDSLNMVGVAVSWDGQEAFIPDMSALSGDLYNVSAGQHRIRFDTGKLGWQGKALKNFRVEVSVPGEAYNYLILDLLTGGYTFVSNAPAGGWIKSDVSYATSKMVFRRCPKGTFTMGASDAMMSRMGMNPSNNQQLKAHQVTLTDDYYMQVDMLTLGHVHSITSRADGVSASDITYVNDTHKRYTSFSYRDFRCNPSNSNPKINWPSTGYSVAGESLLGKARTILAGKLPAGWIIDLPTAAQWERACKATTPDDQYWSVGGTVDSTGDELTNFVKQVATTMIGVAKQPDLSLETRLPNGWGLYDMIGLRAEFVLDQTSSSAAVDATDPVGPNVTSGNPNRLVNLARGDNPSILHANRWCWYGYSYTTGWFSTRLCIHLRNVFGN